MVTENFSQCENGKFLIPCIYFSISLSNKPSTETSERAMKLWDIWSEIIFVISWKVKRLDQDRKLATWSILTLWKDVACQEALMASEACHPYEELEVTGYSPLYMCIFSSIFHSLVAFISLWILPWLLSSTCLCKRQRKVQKNLRVMQDAWYSKKCRWNPELRRQL